MSNQWKMVPVEMDDGMYQAFCETRGIFGTTYKDGYRAAVLAAPVPPAGDVEVLRKRLESARSHFSRWNGRLLESLREERLNTARLTAQRDDWKARCARRVEDIQLQAQRHEQTQSELTKARELNAEARYNECLSCAEDAEAMGAHDVAAHLREWAAKKKSTPIAHNVDESCGQDAEAAKGGV